jgi:ribokinase
MLDVITFGSATLDVFLRSPGMEVEKAGAERDICVSYGAKLEVTEIFFESGGGGTNSAVTFARQGLKVAAVVQIGSDFAGDRVLSDLKKEGIDTSLIDVEPDIFTDYGTILWAGDGGRTILIYRGPTRLEIKDIPWESLEAKWFYLSSLEGNLAIVERLIKDYPTTKIAWNPGNRELKQKEEVLSLLPNITQLNVNKEEMEMLISGGKKMEINELLRKAQELACEFIVITDDRRGAYLWQRNASRWIHTGVFEDSRRLETTGAGDSFGSGLVAGLIKEMSLEDCLHLATANASSVISQVGGKNGILKESEFSSWPKEGLVIEEVKP